MVIGIIGNDTIHFSDFEVISEFGLVRSISDDFADFAIDGILGLGPKPLKDSNSYIDMTTIMDVLAEQGAIEKKMYSVALARASDPVNDGVLNFGGIDTSMYEGDITFSNMIAGSSMWQIPIDGAKVSGKDIWLGSGKSAIIDTGTSLVGLMNGILEKWADGNDSYLRLFWMRSRFMPQSRMRKLMVIRILFLAILRLPWTSHSTTFPILFRRWTI